MSDIANNPNSDDKPDFNRKLYNIDNWQQLHVQQLSYTRNLVIILSSAALGYSLNKIDPTSTDTFNLLFIISSIILLISIGIGFIIAYGESENYRLKYLISRNILRNKSFGEKIREGYKIREG